MDMKKLLSIVDNSGTKEKTVITEGKNMAMDMVMQQYSKPQQTVPKFKSRINEYFKVVDEEMLKVLKEEQEQKKMEVKKIVNRVLTRMDESKTVKATAPKPRNFVAKNATTSGAGAHKDKKKAEKQGDVKHKKELVPMDESERTMSRAAKGNEKYGKDGMKALAKAGREGASEKKLDAIRNKHDKYDESIKEGRFRGDAYDRDYASSIAGMDGSDKRDFKRREMEHELGHETNNYAVAINGKTWKVFGTRSHAEAVARKIQMRDPNKKVSVHETGAPVSEQLKESYGSVEVGAPVKVYSNVLKKAVFGKVVKLKEGRAYVQYDNTKIVMGHPIETVQLNEAATVTPPPTGAMGALKAVGQKAARFVPGLGLVAGGVDAYDRIKKGDYTGAALSAGAGLASFVPVVGTAAAMGLTAAQLGRDKARTGSFLPSEEEQLAAAARDKGAAPGQTATPAPGAMTPNPKTPAATKAPAATAAPSIKDPLALQKELLAVGANLGPTGADGKIGKFTRAAMADPKYAEIVKKYTTTPGQAATPGTRDKIASAVTAALPVAGAAARQALAK